MSRSFHIGQYLQGFPPYCVHAGERFNSLIGEVILELFDRNCQQRKTLTDIFVKVLRDPVTFPFFCLNHSAVHAGKRIFRQPALRNIQRHAEHSLGVAVPCIVELASPCEPANCPVGPYNAKFCRIQLLVLPCIRDPFRDSRPVIRMHVTNELFPGYYVSIGRYSKDCLQVAEPNIPPAFEIKVPPY